MPGVRSAREPEGDETTHRHPCLRANHATLRFLRHRSVRKARAVTTLPSILWLSSVMNSAATQAVAAEDEFIVVNTVHSSRSSSNTVE